MATDTAINFSKPSRAYTDKSNTPPPPPPHKSDPLPSNSPISFALEDANSSRRMPVRRPLSSSSANISSRSSGQRASFVQETPDTSYQRTIPKRQSSYEVDDDAFMREPRRESDSYDVHSLDEENSRTSLGQIPVTQSIPYRQRLTKEAPEKLQEPQAAVFSSINGSAPNSRHTSGGSFVSQSAPEEAPPPLQYHHQPFHTNSGRRSVDSSASRNRAQKSSDSSSQLLAPTNATYLGANLPRPSSTYSSNSELAASRKSLSPAQYGRSPSPSRQSPDPRPMSYVDLLNVPYPQPPPAPSNLDNSHLRSAIGQNASLLSTKKTLDMYRANVKKTSDPTIQYEFAIFMINAAQEMKSGGFDDDSSGHRSPKPTQDRDGSHGDTSNTAFSYAEMLRESRQILQKLSDRSYPFAQYYLADGYASGLFNKGIEDNDRAFPLFIAASKHGHAEAGYRAALCYEFGWGCRKDPPKAVQFYRQSASKNHPGAMSRLGLACLAGDLGLGKRYREGVKWLKRATESADFQYNSAPYELGLLHETGYGDDIFKDEAYAAQLFTQSADLGHVEANYRLGDAYEHGKLACPKDPALSVHFYTRAAEGGHPLAMMALCAWYMVGAEPVLEKDENEAYEWARKAAETGLPKAEYAVGYFTEMGIGCRRDPLESNAWYVKAAEHGDARAKHRIAAIRDAASGSSISSAPTAVAKAKKTAEEEKAKKKWGLF